MKGGNKNTENHAILTHFEIMKSNIPSKFQKFKNKNKTPTLKLITTLCFERDK